MKRFVETICLVTFCILPSLAQSNHVIYNENKEPLEFANVAFYTADTVFVDGVISNKDGSFTTPSERNVDLVRISLVGYETRWLSMPIQESIVLQQANTQLKEIVVNASPSMKLSGSSIVVNVQSTPFKDLANADDVLGQLPSVRAQDGVYSVFGKGTATIYINNRKLIDNSELERLAPSNIATIEIIRNPGAAYDADVPAVIKIKLKRPANDGWGAQVSTSGRLGRRLSDQENLSITYGANLINLFLEASNTSTRVNTDQTNVSDYYSNNSVWRMTSDMPEWDSNYYTYRLSGGINAQIASNHQIGTRWDYTKDISRYGGLTNNNILYNGEAYETLMSQTFSNTRYNQIMGNLFYDGALSPKFNITFNADYVSRNSDNEDATTEEGDRTAQHANLNKGKADYTLWASKLTANWKVEDNVNLTFGADGSITDQDRTNNGYDDNEIYSQSRMKSRDTKGALFVECGFNLSKLQVFTGLRYEATNMDYRDILLNEQLLDKTYRRFYPNVTLSMPINKVNMSLSYTSKVNRPTFYQLRNGSEYFNRYVTTEGNPMLLPQYTSDLSYSLQYKTFNASVGYQWVENYMQSENDIINDYPLSIISRPINMPDYQNLYMSLSCDKRISFWHPYISANLTKTFFDVNTVSPNMPTLGERPYITISMSNWLYLGKWRLLLNAQYNSDGYMREYHEHTATMIGANIIRTFFNNSLYISLQFNNIFHSNEKETSFRSNEIFCKTRYRDNQTVRLYVRYRLKYKKKYAGSSSAQSEVERM